MRAVDQETTRSDDRRTSKSPRIQSAACCSSPAGLRQARLCSDLKPLLRYRDHFDFYHHSSLHLTFSLSHVTVQGCARGSCKGTCSTFSPSTLLGPFRAHVTGCHEDDRSVCGNRTSSELYILTPSVVKVTTSSRQTICCSKNMCKACPTDSGQIRARSAPAT